MIVCAHNGTCQNPADECGHNREPEERTHADVANAVLREALPPRWSIAIDDAGDGWSWSARRNDVFVASGYLVGGTRAQAEIYAKRHAQEWAGAVRMEPP